MDELLEILESIFNKLKNNISKIKLETNNDVQQIIAASLYGTILENCSSCILLFRNQHFTSVPILIRNMFEALIDLAIIKNEPNYYNYMIMADLVQEYKILKDVIDKYNSKKLTAFPVNIQYFREKFKITKKRIKQLKNDGYENLHVSDRLARAGVSELYYNFYALLCQESHNNFSALKRRHIEKMIGENRINFFKDRPTLIKITFLYFIKVSLDFSTDYLIHIFKLSTKEYEKFKRLSKEFEIKKQLLQSKKILGIK